MEISGIYINIQTNTSQAVTIKPITNVSKA